MSCTLTLDEVAQVLKTRGGGLLHSGNHDAPPANDSVCEMCVRELRALACGLVWTDTPDTEAMLESFSNYTGSTDNICQQLNDMFWSSNETRTRFCLPLALLSEATAPEGWVAEFRAQMIRQFFSRVLSKMVFLLYEEDRIVLEKARDLCQEKGDLVSLKNALETITMLREKTGSATDSAYRAKSCGTWILNTMNNGADNLACLGYAISCVVTHQDEEGDAFLALAVRILLEVHNRHDLARTLNLE